MDEKTYQEVSQDIMANKEKASKYVKYRQPLPLTASKARYPGFHQRVIKYKAGQIVISGALALPADLILHESVQMTLRDGVNLYSDIFLPSGFDNIEGYFEEADRVPAIIAWSPYGKQQGTTLLDDFPMRMGVPKQNLSGLQKWEGPDPARWCADGYAVINPDTRGAYTSDGDCLVMGRQEAEDGAEFVEWVARQPWCNGKVALSGNSWLAMSQWSIGALRPKGLAALAPWEGLLDHYRDDIYPGGIPFVGFTESIINTFAGRSRLEDVAATARKNPLMNEYWEDKKGHPELINVPTYVVASWTNMIHTSGTFRAYGMIPENVPKWLRVHNSQEWPDYYKPQHQDDLRRFFDYFLKGLKTNGWDATPKVRLCILDYGMSQRGDSIDRAESGWPLSRTRYVPHYLNHDQTLSLAPPEASDQPLSYDSQNGRVSFKYNFPKDQETTGNFMAHLNVSCAGHDDMDVFVQIEKLDIYGKRQGVQVVNFPSTIANKAIKIMHDWDLGTEKFGMFFHWGPDGRLRSSHALDKNGDLSTVAQPYYTHQREVKMKQGEVRSLDIGIRPGSMLWKKGDTLRFTISGKPVIPFPLPGVEAPETINRGEHFIHCGHREHGASYILLPYV